MPGCNAKKAFGKGYCYVHHGTSHPDTDTSDTSLATSTSDEGKTTEGIYSAPSKSTEPLKTVDQPLSKTQASKNNWKKPSATVTESESDIKQDATSGSLAVKSISIPTLDHTEGEDDVEEHEW